MSLGVGLAACTAVSGAPRLRIPKTPEQLSELESSALEVGYTTDVTRTPPGAFLGYRQGQSCGKCALYRGGPTGGPCKMFPERWVTVTGWCTEFQ